MKRQRSRASRVIIDVAPGPDGVWRMIPGTRNQARRRDGIDWTNL